MNPANLITFAEYLANTEPQLIHAATAEIAARSAGIPTAGDSVINHLVTRDPDYWQQVRRAVQLAHDELDARADPAADLERIARAAARYGLCVVPCPHTALP